MASGTDLTKYAPSGISSDLPQKRIIYDFMSVDREVLLHYKLGLRFKLEILFYTLLHCRHELT